MQETTKPSDLFIQWCNKYPTDYITLKYGGDRWKGLIGTAGHFVNALFEGRLGSAFARADFENLKKLQDLVGMTKAQYFVSTGEWPASAKGERYLNPKTGEII